MNDTAEKLLTCPGCGTPNFTPKGLKAHKCRGENRSAAGKPESHLAKVTRELKESKANSTPPKRGGIFRGKKVLEVAARGLRVPAGDLQPHEKLGRIGLLTDIIDREDKLGKKASGHNREAHQLRAAELQTIFGGLVESIAEHGLKEPLKVTRDAAGVYHVVDGRHRLEACRKVIATTWGDAACEARARAMETEGIPCVEIPESEVDGVIISALNNRQLTKAARALAALMIHPEIAEDAQVGRKSRNDCGITQESLAAMVGVSLRTMEDACAFWRDVQLKKKAADREEMLNQVFAGISFVNVQIGAMGREATKDKTRKDPQPAILLFKAARTMGKQFASYDDLQRDDQVRFLKDLDAAMQVAPKEVRRHLAEMLAAYDPT